MTAWRAADGTRPPPRWTRTGVHVPDAAVQVPVTVPLGSRVTGATLQPYAGELSGWTSRAATAVLPVPGGDLASLLVAATAPTAVTATPSAAKAVTVGWAAPADAGSSPVTSYLVRTFIGTAATPRPRPRARHRPLGRGPRPVAEHHVPLRRDRGERRGLEAALGPHRRGAGAGRGRKR